jgi:hypothetical protein
MKHMVRTKAKTAFVTGACLLLAVGIAAVFIYTSGRSMRIIQSEWSAISCDRANGFSRMAK